MSTAQDDLRSRVEYERHVHGWSKRDAAAAGGVSNTTWGNWENGDVNHVTDTMRMAVAKAFGWPTTWPESPPAWPTIEAGDPVVAEILDPRQGLAD